MWMLSIILIWKQKKGVVMAELRNQALIKSINRAKALNAIRLHSPIARAQIADMTGLDRKSLTNFVSELIAEGLVVETGTPPRDGMGRPFTMLEFKRRLVMGLEISSGAVNGVMLDLYGRLRASHRIDDERINDDPERLLRAIKSVYQNLRGNSEGCQGVGIGVQGVVESSNGEVLEAVNIPSAKMNLREALREFIGERIFMEGSSASGALAEKWFGAGTLHNDFIYVELGAGIGAGIVGGRRIYRGAGMHAGELGHVVIAPGGDACRCGNRGCLEAYASERRIAEDAGKLLGRPIGSLDELAPHSSNPAIAKLLSETGEKIGFGVGSLVNLLNPKVIIFGGRPIELFETQLLPAIRQGAAKASLGSCMKDVSILPSGIKDAIAKGAATLALSSIFEVEGHHYI